MVKRITIEVDEQLLSRAMRALGQDTIRATVEEALRRAVVAAEDDDTTRAARQQEFLQELDARIDLGRLASNEMWR